MNILKNLFFVSNIVKKEKNKKNVNNDNAFADFGDIVEVE